MGVRGMTLDEGDELVGMVSHERDQKPEILVLSENGFGKRTRHRRIPYNHTWRQGRQDDTGDGEDRFAHIHTKRHRRQRHHDNHTLGSNHTPPASDIRLTGRATQGVKVINLRSTDAIASVVVAPKTDDEETPEGTTPDAQTQAVDDENASE